MLGGKVTLITGCSRGIGRATAELFAQQGATVYANARKTSALDALCAECKNIIPLYFDVTDNAAVKAAIMRIKREHGKLDCLVNNAGIMNDALIGMIGSETVRMTFETNVFAVIELTQLAARLMKKQMSGSVINFSSIVGQAGFPGQLAYSASKGAIIALTKTAAKELAPFNIRVNAVAPGMIDTDMFRSIGFERMRERRERIGMGRLGLPEEVANLCLFLASDLSQYVTGEVIGINGAAVI